MRAAFVAVGSELLGTHRLDTNSLRVAALLRRYGVSLVRKAVVGDDREELESEVRGLLAATGRRPYDLVILSGGLGPTADDVTREAVAAACGRSLSLDEAIVADIAAKFRAFGRRMPDVNRRQALVIEGAAVLPNRRGTAPGLRLEAGDTTFFLLPGVPVELDGLLEEQMEPWLQSQAVNGRVETGVLKVACLPESEVEERLAPLYEEVSADRVSVLASAGEIRVEVRAGGPGEEDRVELARLLDRSEALLAPAVFSRRAEESLEAVVGVLLRERGATVATAESCTGGLVAQRLTAVAGSSLWFQGGVVAYSNRSKEELVEVSSAALAEHGAVSKPVALALAQGARQRLHTDFGIGITGIAGPGGGSEEKPVGTVHVAVVGPDGFCRHRKVRFPGDRKRVRRMTSQLAIEMLRRRLLGLEDEVWPTDARSGTAR